MIHEHVLSAIGNTPLVELRRLNPNPRVKVLAKLECFNPGGSIKDRVALAMIEAAERSGELTPDKTVIEATSGNTGIGLAMVCAVKGYKLMLLMSERASVERQRIVSAYGAQIKLTPGHLSTDGAIEEAYRMAREEPDKYVLMDQFNNPASMEAHYKGTGREIWEQTEGKVTHVVASLGTSGTVMGLTKRLKDYSRDVTVVVVEPFPGHKIQGLKNMQESYPPGIFDKNALDSIVHVEDEEAFETCRKMAREEGLFAGMSSGAAVAAALRLAKELDQGMIVVIVPDSGERYLSTPLFEPRARQGVALHNLATSEPKVLAPDNSKPLGLYTLGPALDRPGDLDAWRRIVLLDVLARYMNSRGIAAKACVGVADLDDRALEAARAKNQPMAEYSAQTLDLIRERARELGVAETMLFTPAGNGTENTLDMVRALLAKGAAYEKLRSVYFDVRRVDRYGRMSSMDLDKLDSGKTVDLEAYVKSNPKDFTLLKRASLKDLKAGDCLQTEWGNVRPSWFLQMASAALQSLPRVDVFLADGSHLFPHLDNFRAIWSVARNWEPQAWAACHPLSAQGVDAATGLEHALPKDMELQALRMWLLSTSYRKPLVWSDKSLAMWRKNWARVQHLSEALANGEETGRGGSKQKPAPEVEEILVALKSGFQRAMENDLSLHRFWPVLFKYCRDVRQLLDDKRLSPAEAGLCLKRLHAVDDVLGVLNREAMPLARSAWPEAVAKMLEERDAARKAKDFAKADQLRDAILDQGFRIEDTPQGARLHPA